jgi:hypothetical protein
VDPTEDLLAALREAFPGFKPTGGWWFEVEKVLKTAHHRGNPEAHDAFCRDFPNWSAEDLLRHLEAEGRVKPPRTPRGRTVCELLRELHAKDPDFAENDSERAVAQRIGKKGPGSLAKSDYWLFTLKPRRAEVRARRALRKAGLQSNAATPTKAEARAGEWDQRETVRRRDAVMDAVAILDTRIRDLHGEDPDFAETATEGEIARRIGNVPEDALGMSDYWRLTLTPRRDQLRARARDAEIDGGH